jgi:hypothetical protein
MDTRFLESFAAVVEQGSMAEAARRLNLTPAAIAQRIRVLESEFGVSLLMRIGRTVRPTEAGAAIFAKAVAFLRELESLRAVGLGDLLSGELVALFWLGSKLDNVALWESGTGPTLKNRGFSAFSTSSISRQLFERHDGISVPMAAQPVRLPQRPALALFWATKLPEWLISSSLARFGLQRGSR